ncbi:MAG: hypothetical protein JW795_15155 [Chitinivibrionales bacterium]|nr:hypothetical protein [Chitinivibrionales bacterium]
MQKLDIKRLISDTYMKKPWCSCRGSTLVAVVTFSIIIALVTAGYLATMGTTVNHEITALDNDRAFLAAESGLLFGIRWMAEPANFNNRQTGPIAIFNGQINGMQVTVEYSSSPGTPLVIRSRARGGSLPYAKILQWTMHASNGAIGTFINNIGGAGAVGGGGLNNTWFDGPFHANSPILLAAVSNPGAAGAGVRFVNGPVSVHNGTEQRNFRNGGEWANYGTALNNYDFGIFKHNLSENTNQAQDLDDHFTNETETVQYKHSQNRISMSRITTQTVDLPQNFGQTQPFINFSVDEGGIGRGTYYYHDAHGAAQSSTFTVNNQIIRAHNDVQVLGVVKGQATLVTDVGADIIPAGDLEYAGFTRFNADHYDFMNYDNAHNYGISESNTNTLALVSGGAIYLPEHKMQFDGVNNRLIQSNQPDQTLYLTAALYACEEGQGLQWRTKNGRIAINEYDYTLRAIGSRTIDQWFSYDAGGVNSNRMIRFFYDKRFANGIQAPGIPEVMIMENGHPIKLMTGDWMETNTPLSQQGL